MMIPEGSDPPIDTTDRPYVWNGARPLDPTLRTRSFEIFADYHTHTVYSHGKGTIEDNLLAAREKGLSEVAITDHGPAALGIGVREVKTLEVIKARADHYNRLFADIRVLAGVEANVITLDGRLDVPRQALRQLDLRVAGLHWQIKPGSFAAGFDLVFNNLVLAKFSRRMRRRARTVNTKALIEAINRYDLDIISHPGLKMDIDTYDLSRAAARRGTALEISAGHPYMTTDFIKIGLKEGVKFSIDSDAHLPANVGNLERGVRLAARAGLKADDLINARPPQPLRLGEEEAVMDSRRRRSRRGEPREEPREKPMVAMAEELAPQLVNQPEKSGGRASEATPTVGAPPAERAGGEMAYNLRLAGRGKVDAPPPERSEGELDYSLRVGGKRVTKDKTPRSGRAEDTQEPRR
ncbi:MAG TPA: PHP domain-containing protein [Bacillota bacterium]|jgi:putative hydrolase